MQEPILKSDSVFIAIGEQLKRSADLADEINASYLFVIKQNGAAAAEWCKFVPCGLSGGLWLTSLGIHDVVLCYQCRSLVREVAGREIVWVVSALNTCQRHCLHNVTPLDSLWLMFTAQANVVVVLQDSQKIAWTVWFILSMSKKHLFYCHSASDKTNTARKTVLQDCPYQASR